MKIYSAEKGWQEVINEEFDPNYFPNNKPSAKEQVYQLSELIAKQIYSIREKLESSRIDSGDQENLTAELDRLEEMLDNVNL